MSYAVNIKDYKWNTLGNLGVEEGDRVLFLTSNNGSLVMEYEIAMQNGKLGAREVGEEEVSQPVESSTMEWWAMDYKNMSHKKKGGEMPKTNEHKHAKDLDIKVGDKLKLHSQDQHFTDKDRFVREKDGKIVITDSDGMVTNSTPFGCFVTYFKEEDNEGFALLSWFEPKEGDVFEVKIEGKTFDRHIVRDSDGGLRIFDMADKYLYDYDCGFLIKSTNHNLYRRKVIGALPEPMEYVDQYVVAGHNCGIMQGGGEFFSMYDGGTIATSSSILEARGRLQGYLINQISAECFSKQAEIDTLRSNMEQLGRDMNSLRSSF